MSDESTTPQEGIPAERATALLATLREDQKSDLVELLAASFEEHDGQRHLPKNVAVPALTPKVIEALRLLPEVYGKVRITEPRLLTEAEAKALIEERDAIDTVLGVLKKRKEETLRENLANHLDRRAELLGEADEHTETNTQGHYLVRQDAPVEGTGKKVQGIVSQGKPSVSDADLERLHLAGEISREDYLAITSTPPVKRVFDAAKAKKAILKNPALLTALAKATKKGTKTLTIKVVDDA